MAKKKYENSEGVWRTIGGRRVFIKTGQSLSDAMRESGKFKTRMDEKAVKGAREEDLKEQYMQSLNDVSKMEYNGEITRDDYDEAIKNINKTYKDRMLKQESPVEEEVRLEKEAKESWEKEEKANKSLSRQYKQKEKENDRISKGMTKEEYKEGKYSFEKEKAEYELYKRAKENPDSIDPMTENSTDWEALDRKYSNKYISEKYSHAFPFHKQTDEEKKYADDVAEYFKGKDIKEEVRKAKEEFNKSQKTDFHYAGEELYSDDPNRFGDTVKKHNEKMFKEQQESAKRVEERYLKDRYSDTYEYLQNTTNMSGTEILELLKKIDEDKK